MRLSKCMWVWLASFLGHTHLGTKLVWCGVVCVCVCMCIMLKCWSVWVRGGKRGRHHQSTLNSDSPSFLRSTMLSLAASSARACTDTIRDDALSCSSNCFCTAKHLQTWPAAPTIQSWRQTQRSNVSSFVYHVYPLSGSGMYGLIMLPIASCLESSFKSCRPSSVRYTHLKMEGLAK